MKRILISLGFALLLAALLPTLSFSSNPNPGVLLPNSQSYGMTYGEWNARWFQWAVSMPLDHNPLNDTADCSTAQLGKVWFLGGPFGPNAQPIRECNVPVGKALFFPIVNVDCSSLELPPFFGGTPEERRACVKAIIDTVSGLSVEIDGVSLGDLTNYRATSPDFHFVAPDNNVLGVPAGSGEMAADGYYLLLAPLSEGQHTIHFKGTIDMFAFTAEETYHLTVGK
jgi:hypothetical protein